MRIKMLQTARGSEDCFKVIRLFEGGTYEVADSLAGDLLSKGSARIARQDDVHQPVTQPDYF